LKIELVYERNTSCKSQFSGGDQVILFQKGLSSLDEETHKSHERKPSVIEAGPSDILFTCQNWLVFERNTSCKSEISR
jgi:hypothetical protein